jgi:hypothetical protein
VIGSGLGGFMLAGALSADAEVTVYERGSAGVETPSDVAFSGHERGLAPAFRYGVGGTTALWAGGLIAMLPEEFGLLWPEVVRRDLPQRYPAAVEALYGPVSVDQWRALEPTRLDDGAVEDAILYPRRPFRAGVHSFASLARLLHGVRVHRIEERGDSVALYWMCGDALRVSTYDCVVVAAGGVQSPVLLQASGLGGAAAGFNLTDHPMGFVAKLAFRGESDLARRLSRNDPSTSVRRLVKLRDPETGLFSAFYLRGAFGAHIGRDPYRDVCRMTAATSRVGRIAEAIRGLTNPDFAVQVVEHKFGWTPSRRHVYVLAVAEQEPFGQGRAWVPGAGKAVCHWTVSDAVACSVQRNLDSLARLLDADVILPPDGMMKQRLSSGAHISGTCRIATDPAEGVVDENLRVHGATRVFVADGSVLPSTGASNTGLTIGALALRLAAHLACDVAPNAMRRTAAPRLVGKMIGTV